MFAKFALAFACGLAVMAAPASATVMQAVFIGKVKNSNDQTGLFGLGTGHVLDGLAYSLTYKYDTALGAREMVAGVSDHVYGGALSVGPSPLISAVLKIGNVGQSLLGSNFTTIEQVHNNFPSQRPFVGLVFYAQDRFSDPLTGAFKQNSIIQQGNDYSNVVPPDLTTPYSLSGLQSAGGYLGNFEFVTYAPLTGLYSIWASGSLAADTLSVTALPDVAPVPLPATGGLLAIGLAGLARLRRRRSRLVPSG